MVKTISTVLLVFSTFVGYSQDKLFTVKGKVKQVVFFDEKQNSATGLLSNGDKISIAFNQSAFFVTATHGNLGKSLTNEESGSEGTSCQIGIYEYDFDKDGKNEVVVVHGHELTKFAVEIFRYSEGLAERVGFFGGQFDLVIEDSSISLPFGSQGMSSDYIYKNGAFYELVYNNPETEEKEYYKVEK